MEKANAKWQCHLNKCHFAVHRKDRQNQTGISRLNRGREHRVESTQPMRVNGFAPKINFTDRPSLFFVVHEFASMNFSFVLVEDSTEQGPRVISIEAKAPKGPMYGLYLSTTSALGPDVSVSFCQ